jgi:transcriptional regulator with XRE-family HTH domain/predicted transcriptional regulator
VPESRLDRLIFGQRLRHLRRRRGFTLQELGARVGKPVPYLSMLENGRREPRIRVLNALAAALGHEPADLLATDPPSERARLEIDLARAQNEPLYTKLGLPHLKVSTRLPDNVLNHVLTLYGELRTASKSLRPNPESESVALAELREEIRTRDGYFADIEVVAGGVLSAVRYPGHGKVADSILTDIAAYLGFSVHRVRDLPGSSRSVSDLRHRRIYVPRDEEIDRSVLLETLAHFALGHGESNDLAERARQRVEARYFVAAILAPEKAAVSQLVTSRESRELSVEDLAETFSLTYEMAAKRMVSLSTRHLGFAMHYLKTNRMGQIEEAYENDGIPLPGGPSEVAEGRTVCRKWGAHRVFGIRNNETISHQWTETPQGIFFCATFIEPDRSAAITTGTSAAHARYFHGHDTPLRSVSSCPSEECCRRPSPALQSRWEGGAWALGASVPGIPVESSSDENRAELFSFLERHDPTGNGKRLQN